jgi:hypothetical protein
MPRIHKNEVAVLNLHYALTDSQCNMCGAQLEWKADFDDINQPKYISQHCNQDFVLMVDTVKIEIIGRANNIEKTRKTTSTKESILYNNEDELRGLKIAEAKQEQELDSHTTNTCRGSSSQQKGKKQRELVLPRDSNIIKGNI